MRRLPTMGSTEEIVVKLPVTNSAKVPTNIRIDIAAMNNGEIISDLPKCRETKEDTGTCTWGIQEAKKQHNSQLNKNERILPTIQRRLTTLLNQPGLKQKYGMQRKQRTYVSGFPFYSGFSQFTLQEKTNDSSSQETSKKQVWECVKPRPFFGEGWSGQVGNGTQRTRTEGNLRDVPRVRYAWNSIKYNQRPAAQIIISHPTCTKIKIILFKKLN